MPFATNVSALPPSIYNYTWIIPVFHQSSNDTIAFDWFTTTNSANWSHTADPDQWRVENVGFRTYMRVWYDDTVWAPIQRQLMADPTVFDIRTRSMLVADTVALIEFVFFLSPFLSKLMHDCCF
jgi:hypothetical protein